jgi:hypothetical protein
MKQSYKTKKLQIERQGEGRTATWRFAGRTVRGTEYLYSVKDDNFSSLNRWTFAAQVPRKAYGDIVVRPVGVPSKKVWAGLDRKAVVLVRARKNPYKSRAYCKVNLADPSGDRTKKGTRRGDRGALPKWFRLFRWRMRLKKTVTTTQGTDSSAQIIFMDHGDHETMIKLYFALKVWVMAEDFSIRRRASDVE